MTSEWILYILVGLLVAAAAQDIVALRISNLFPLAIIALFGVWIAVQGVPNNWWENAVHFLIALGIGLGLFAIGWFGGGDAKLYASCALWFSLAEGIALLFSVSMAGLILLLLMLGTRRFRKKRRPPNPFEEAGSKKSMQMPYGVAIAAGVLFAIYWIGVNPAASEIFDPTAVPIPLNS